MTQRGRHSVVGRLVADGEPESLAGVVAGGVPGVDTPADVTKGPSQTKIGSVSTVTSV
ncbi:hypothetical protein ACIBJF_34265 [Streptomyces sp. NPDC050743]|uniref:hypothetical protein n=1 Tax=Streptomyces sp. NPDC050743 TaxID=3365634 RepID=UPI0037A2ECAA